jgi:hypothetical protein
MERTSKLMTQPNNRTVLYVVPSEYVPLVAHEAVTTRPGAIAHADAEALVAALRQGKRVQALTTLPQGIVLFAVE